MAESIQKLPDFSEVHDLFQGRRPDLPEKEVSIEQIEILDRTAAQSAMNAFAEEVYPKYRDVSEDDPSGTTRSHEEEQMTKTNVPLGEVVVDASVPLTMDVYKNFTNERGRRSESINFYLYKGSGDAQDFIGNISVADRGEDGFDIIDRLVESKFRKQGLGKMFLNCAEAFVQKASTERQQPVKAFANMSQLNVIYWFWKNGYRPETDEDRRRLDMILTGHGDLELLERNFVFHKDTPDKDRYFVKPDGEFALDGDGGRVINYNNALRIRMVKVFEAGVGEQVEDIVDDTRVDLEL